MTREGHPMDPRFSVRAAPPPGDDPIEYVMSDDTVDRMGDVIDPKGWKLHNFTPDRNPVALFNHDKNQVIGNWLDVRIVRNRLLGRLALAAAGTSELVDTIRSLVTQNVLRAVSVGFQPLKREPLDEDADEFWGPFRFLEHELLECSLVSVPANPNALALAKSMNLPRDVITTIFSKPANENRGVIRTLTGKPAKHLAPTGVKMLTRSQKIEAAQATLNDMRDRLDALEAIENRTEADEAAYAELPPQIEETHRALTAMQAAERADALLAGKTGQRLPTTGRIQAPTVIAKPKTSGNERDYLYKTMSALFVARATGRHLDDVLRDPMRYGHDEIAGAVTRAVTNPALTTVPAWAGELVTTGFANFLDQLPRTAIYPTLKRLGSSFTFGRDGIIKIPSRSATPKINGSFVGEGQPIPVRKAGLTSVSLTPKKMAVISTMSKEMAEHSNPSIESVIRQAINEDTAEAIDTALIDATAADAIRPAGLLAGLSAQTAASSGTQFEKMVADINTLAAPITANRGGNNLVLLMNPAQKRKMSWAVAPNGTFVFSTVENGQVRDLTVVASTTVAAGTLIMLDADEFATATGDSPQFDVSDVSTIHEEDTLPLPIVGGIVQPPVIGSIAAPVRSLWQTASIGIRMILPMNWTMRRTGMVTYMTGVTW
jgi:HK97 family phage major capsid protein/HK97 family phage prohead protease